MLFWQKLTRTTRLLGSATLLLAALNAWQLLRYQPWNRLPLRLSYADAHGYPVYSDSTEFLVNGQRLTAFDYSFRGFTDSTDHNSRPDLLGTWVSDAGVDGRPLRVPNQLQVSYTSLAEGRSYRGRFALPAPVLDSLLAEMRRQPDRYSTLFGPGETKGAGLQACLAPGGVVLVRLLGEDYQAEVARFQARPCPTAWPKPPAYRDTLPYRSLAALRRCMARAEQAHLDSFPAVPLGHWDTLRTRYAYCLRVLAPLRPHTLRIDYLNEDEEFLDPAAQPLCLHQPLPDYVSYTPADDHSAAPSHSTGFDPVELRRAFAQLRRTAPGERPELQIRPGPVGVRVLLKTRRQTIELMQSVTYVGP